MSMSLVSEGATVLTATEKGYGKKTLFEHYRLQSRGGSGVFNLKITPKTGDVIGTATVLADDEIILATSGGMIVRSAVKGIRTCGRNTQGVKLINLKENDTIASIARVLIEENIDGEEAVEEN